MISGLRALSARGCLTATIALCWLSPVLGQSESPVQRQDMAIVADAERRVPTRLFAPAGGCDDCPLVIFSHGAYSTYDRYDRLLLAWARAGLVVAAPLHVDSEAHPDREDYDQSAALPTRVADYLALRESLTQPGRLQSMGISLSGGIIAAGHSFGALIAQIAGGANPPTLAGADLAALAGDAPEAVVAISPPPAIQGYIEASHWAQMSVPMLVVTGTTDVIPEFVTDWRLHLLSYEAASKDLRYALVFDEANHYFNGAFGRPTAEGARMEGVIAVLNQSIVGFIQATLDGVSPTETAWWQALPGTVRPLAHGESVNDE